MLGLCLYLFFCLSLCLSRTLFLSLSLSLSLYSLFLQLFLCMTIFSLFVFASFSRFDCLLSVCLSIIIRIFFLYDFLQAYLVSSIFSISSPYLFVCTFLSVSLSLTLSVCVCVCLFIFLNILPFLSYLTIFNFV